MKGRQNKGELKIKIICAYYGPLPSCFLPWLKTVEYNPTIDFLLITDQEVYAAPYNLNVVRIEFDQLKCLITRKIGQDASLEIPYKLCDYKPLYGILFSDFLAECDYWGHCDMDMAFGDIRSFVTKYDLEKYDKFLALGHLSLYRNTEENNHRFMLSGSLCGDWQDVISDSRAFTFDELGGIYQIFKKNGFPVFDEKIYADITSIYKRFRCISAEQGNYRNQIFYWEDGKVLRDYWSKGKKYTEEFIYIHFKKRKFEEPRFDISESNAFYISPLGYTEKNGPASLAVVEELNPYPGWFYEQFEHIRFYVRLYWEKARRRFIRRVSK